MNPLGPSATAPWAMSYLRTFGPRANSTTALIWGLMALSCFVVVLITLLVVWGVAAKRSRARHQQDALPAPERGPGGLSFLYWGLGFTGIALFASLIWTVTVMAAINSPASKPALTIEVIGHQWWWEARYSPDDPAHAFSTANELHVPVGQPVQLKLTGADVIHSFWIPTLSGKTDTIPGRTNVAWIQADQPGVYRGQCTEYCGLQHAHMAAYVYADRPADFDAWRVKQMQPAADATGPLVDQGKAVFQGHCSACHTIRGTPAGGALGPDLTHLMTRATLASGTVPNTPAGLSGWIADPQALKPGTLMPATYLSGPDLKSLRAYLETLQ